MEAVFIYFLKANGLLILFFLAYFFLLRKETFFTKNRWFLLLGLFATVLLPLITFTKVIWVDPTPISFETATNDYIPYIIENNVIEEPINWNSILIYIYAGISILFVSKVFIEVLSFFRIIKFGKRTKTEEAILIDDSANENPFSFFKHIVFNSQMFSEEELEHIIIHENIHVKEKHSIDVLISKIFCAFFWINPIMWFYQKEMLQNLEYIADEKASAIAQNKINYQKTLLKVVTHQHQLSITNQFYQSLIKKRIVMLNTNPSHQKNSWKYALILPVLSAFMLLFQVETVAQVKEQVTEETNYKVSSNYSSILTKNTTDEELKELEETFSDENQKLSISKVKRNKNGEIIAIKLTFDSGKTYNQILERKSSEPIKDIKIYVDSDNNDTISCGFIEFDNEKVNEEILDENAINVNGFSKTSQEYWSMDNMTKNGKEVVLIINGKVKGATEKVKIPLNEELGDMKELTPAEFEKKYNKKADKNKYYYEVETVKVKTIVGSWKDNETSEQNRLYIINGKEYMQNEIPKGTTISLDGMVTELSKEEGIKKYGPKAKDGVLIFEGKSTFVKNDSKTIPFEKIIKEENNTKQTNQIGYVFDKRSSDNEFENDAKVLKEKYNIDFKVIHKKRNSKGEIIELKLSFDDNKGTTGKYQQIRTIAIRPVFMKVNINENGKNEIGFYDNHEMVNKPKDEVMESKISIIENLADNAVIYVDGELYSKEDVEYLDVNGLESIKILKDKESLKKYNALKNKEVIIIETNWKTKK